MFEREATISQREKGILAKEYWGRCYGMAGP